jgi:ketosteroid isomerase-like protein
MTMNGINRSTQEVFEHHMDAFSRKNLEDLATDFNNESILIMSPGAKSVGVDAISQAYSEIFKSMQEGTIFTVKQVITEGDIVFLEWTLSSQSSGAVEGVDTFVIRQGIIYAQTVKIFGMPEALAIESESAVDSLGA